MHIDYYCFGYRKKSGAGWGNNPAFDDIYNSFMKARSNEEIAFAEKINKCIFYNEDDGKIYFDRECKEEVKSLKDKLILPRTHILGFVPMLNSIKKLEGISHITEADSKKTLYWPKYVGNILPYFRSVKITTLKESVNELREAIKEKKKIFIKTVEKGISNVVCAIDDVNDKAILKMLESLGFGAENVSLINTEGNPFRKFNQNIMKLDEEKKKYRLITGTYESEFSGSVTRLGDTILEDEPIIVSDVVDICKEQGGEERNLEYRGFVMDGKLDRMSLMLSNEGEKVIVPNDIIDKAEEVIRMLKKTQMPSIYSLDLMRVNINGKRQMDVVEFNNLACAGREMGNSFFTHEGIEF